MMHGRVHHPQPASQATPPLSHGVSSDGQTSAVLPHRVSRAMLITGAQHVRYLWHMDKGEGGGAGVGGHQPVAAC